MKAKTMLGMIACASACVSLSAFGNETNGWFGVTVANTTVTTINVATNNIGEAQGGKLVLTDVEKTNPLTFTPSVNAPTNRNDGIFVIQAAAALTPNSTNDLDVIDGAKAGFAVGIDDNDATNYYGYANGSWNKLAGVDVVAEGQDTTFKLVLNYRDSKIDFYAGANAGTHLGQFDMVGGATTPGAIDAYGTGSISSITGAYEVAAAAYDGKKYGSVAEAVNAAKNDSHSATDVQAVDSNGAAQSSSATASNGLNLVVCEAMGLPTDKTTDEATVKLEASTKSNAGKITLAWKKPEAAEDGVTIKFQVKKDGVDEGDPCDWDDIKIPMVSGIYTVEPSIQ